MTTSFVMATFAEWFANSTFDTVRKNLRTTTGRHKIEIDENILSKYIPHGKYAKRNEQVSGYQNNEYKSINCFKMVYQYFATRLGLPFEDF